MSVTWEGCGGECFSEVSSCGEDDDNVGEGGAGGSGDGGRAPNIPVTISTSAPGGCSVFEDGFMRDVRKGMEGEGRRKFVVPVPEIEGDCNEGVYVPLDFDVGLSKF